MRQKLLSSLTALALSMALPAFAADKTADASPELHTAAIGMGDARSARRVALPQVLSQEDARAYQKVLKLQQQAQWPLADRELDRIDDDLLLGYVLAQRYLHPMYKPRFQELKEWMAAYSGLPDADAVYKLSQGKAFKGMGAVNKPSRGYMSGAGIAVTDNDSARWEDFGYDGGKHLSQADRRKLRDMKAKIRQTVRKGGLDAAQDMLKGGEARRLFDKADIDEMKLVLAAHHFAGGRDQQALELAAPVAERSGDVLPVAHWMSGLIHWRQGRTDQSRRHFEAVANTKDSSGWMVAAGAYWAARANLVSRRPEVVDHWLGIAAAYPRTFYGLLANRALNQPVEFAWETPPLTEADVEIVTRVESGRRAVALLQIGERDKAEDELRKLSPTATPALTQSMLALAHAGQMPSLALKLGRLVADRDGRYHDAAAYPMPDWKPKGGWSIDKALVYAFIRQESAFNPAARSHAGATGLMQLMPATATFIAGKGSEGKLTEPEYNLSLGQRYLEILLSQDSVKGNLLLLAAGYNAGPGNMARWQQTVPHRNDPLLFIESIPSRETRVFVERVMTNFWIYRTRMGQPTPSLDAVVAGEWPHYDALDKDQMQVAKNVKN